MDQSVGIDLGTTYSAVATVDATEHAVILPNRHGQLLTPSVIYLGGDTPLVGEEAKEMQALGEMEVAAFFKRNMGDPYFIFQCGNREYTPVDLSSLILRTLRADAEAALGKPLSKAVITVPAYFNNFQREATIAAGEQAGLEVLRIINEPTAAVLAYGLQQERGTQTVLVYDLGGGTFDVTLARITPTAIEVLATDGDHELGGKDWDDRLVIHLGQRFHEDYRLDPLDDTLAFHDLLVRCEQAKRQLSIRDRARIVISHAGQKATYEVTREQFEAMTHDLMERTQRLTENVLYEAGLDWSRLDGVLLVGGSTRMPMVGQYVKAMAGKPPMGGVNVDEAVALGAALQAYLDATEHAPTGQRFTLSSPKVIQDVMSHSLGLVAENEDRSRYINSIIVPKNTLIPCQEIRPFQLRTTHGQTNHLEVYVLQGESQDPSQCVMLGKYTFTDITHVATGLAIIDIGYAYNRNGVVTVTATERATGNTLSMQVDPLPSDLAWLSLPPPDAATVPAHISVFLVMDVSGSMEGLGLREAKQAAKAFISKSDLAHTSIGLIEFGSRAKVVNRLTQSAKDITKAIDRLNISGSTNMTDGLRLAHSELKHVTAPRFIILLTDGYPDNAVSALRAAEAICADGIELITIGTGGANKEYLQRLACSDENSIFAQAGTVVATFSKIAQVLTESGGSRELPAGGQHQPRRALKFFGE